MPDAVFDAAVSLVLRHEGGYSNDPLDHGSETNFGISSKAYPDIDVRNLTLEKAKAIYYTDYWLRYRINQIPGVSIPVKVLDTAVVMGPGTAIRLLQRALVSVGEACDVDGSIGPQTVQACRSASAEALLAIYRSLLLEHYDRIAAADPSQQRFLRGWEARALA